MENVIHLSQTAVAFTACIKSSFLSVDVLFNTSLQTKCFLKAGAYANSFDLCRVCLSGWLCGSLACWLASLTLAVSLLRLVAQVRVLGAGGRLENVFRGFLEYHASIQLLYTLLYLL